jgi:hypothetical protein
MGKQTTEQITRPGQGTLRSLPPQFSQQVLLRLGELSAEFAGWRIGRGGSGHWWAVRGNELVRTRDVDELRDRLHELTAAG